MPKAGNSGKDKVFVRLFWLICLFLILIDLPLTVFYDNHYINNMNQQNTIKMQSIIEFLLTNPQYIENKSTLAIRALENHAITIKINEHPAFKNTFIFKANLDEAEKISRIKKYFASKTNALSSPSFYVSMKLADNSHWVNISMTPHHETKLSILSVLLEMLVILGATTYFISIYWLSKPWRKIYDISQKLGLPEPSSNSFLGYAIIKESISLMEIMINKIEALLSEKVATIASLSHDIRTPLAKAKLHLEKIKETDLKNNLDSQLDEIGYYLNQTLRYARQEYRDEPKRNIDIVSLLESVCTDNSTGHATAVNFKSNVDVYLLQGQNVSLRRAFSNLIENGLKYGNAVTVILSVEDDHVQILIEDKGNGLPADMLKKVFEPFFRYHDKSRKHAEGTGLGLVIAKNILTHNGATIKLENIPSGGLRVIICIQQKGLK